MTFTTLLITWSRNKIGIAVFILCSTLIESGSNSISAVQIHFTFQLVISTAVLLEEVLTEIS